MERARTAGAEITIGGGRLDPLGRVVVEVGPEKDRLRIRPPSMINLSALREMCQGHKIQDIVIILGSVNLTMADVDR